MKTKIVLSTETKIELIDKINFPIQTKTVRSKSGKYLLAYLHNK